MHNEAAIEKSLEIGNSDIINRHIRLYEAAGYYLPQKRAPFFAFFYKIRAKTQQVLPVQTASYRSDE